MELETRRKTQTSAYQFPQKTHCSATNFISRMTYNKKHLNLRLRLSGRRALLHVPLRKSVCARTPESTSHNIVHVFHNSISKIA
jgi:hypothetical protein